MDRHEREARELLWPHGGIQQMSFQMETQLERVAAALRERSADTERLDWIADERVFEGIGGADIDDWTAGALAGADQDGDDSEDVWRMEWRRQLRNAIDFARRREP